MKGQSRDSRAEETQEDRAQDLKDIFKKGLTYTDKHNRSLATWGTAISYVTIHGTSMWEPRRAEQGEDRRDAEKAM